MNDTPTSYYVLQLRWADLDSLNHVNNVRYVDFALEALAQLVDEGVVPADVPIARIEVDFLRPLLLSLSPVRILSRVEDGRVELDIRDADTVYARVVVVLDSLTRRFGQEHEGPAYFAHVRRADVDAGGQLRPAQAFELFQESRILHFSRLLERVAPGNFVVARLAVDYHRPIVWRHEPWLVANWISKVGTSSLEISSHIADGADVYTSCEATLVGFDLETQKSRRLTEDEKAQLSAGL